MARSIEWYYRLSYHTVQTHGCSLHPISRSVGFFLGWDGDSNFLGFYLILISALEHIRYLMTSSPDVRNMSNAVSSFGDIVEECFAESSVTCNLMCAMVLLGICTWIYRYRCKSPKQPP